MGMCLDELYPDEETGMNTLSLNELEEALKEAASRRRNWFLSVLTLA